MAKKVEILFTGRNDATFKMGKKMDDVIRPLVEKYGKENVTLVHGGNQKNSPVDRNVVKYGELSGLNTVSNPLDRSKKNAANIRTQERIDNPNLIHYSFNSKGDLNLKDKYEGYWRDYYEKLGKETIGKGDVRPEGSLRFPKKKYKKDAQGKPTKDLQSQSTLETSKFKSLLDKVEDDTNLERQMSGVTFAKNKDAWTKENIGFNLITEKNQPRIDHIERGTGLATGQTTYTADADEPELESTAKPQQKLVPPKKLMRKFKGPHWTRRVKLEDTAGTNRQVYVDDTRGELNEAGRRGGASLIRNIKTGEVLEKTNKYKVSGTLLTSKTKKIEQRAGIRYTTYGDPVKGPSGYGSSSLTQLENIELAEPVEHREAKRKALQDPKLDSDIDVGEDKSSSGKGMQRHKISYAVSQQGELNKDVTNLIERVKQAKSIQRKNKRILRTGSKQKFIGAKSAAVKRILNTVPDVLSFDKQSQTAVDVKKPQIYGNLSDTTKAGRDKQVRINIKKGPNPFGYNTSKERAIRENKTGIVTGKARQLKSSILAPRKGGQTRLSKYPSLWSVNKPIIKLEPTTAMVKAEYQKAQRTFGVSSSKKLPLPKPKTKLVTSVVTPKKNRVQWWRLKSAPKPTKKVVTTTAKKVTSELQKVFHKPTGTANVEDKHKKLKSTGKGIKFTRGLGAFSIFSSIFGVARGRKEAKRDLGREPNVMESLEYTFLSKEQRQQTPWGKWRKNMRDMGIHEVQ